MRAPVLLLYFNSHTFVHIHTYSHKLGFPLAQVAVISHHVFLFF